MKFTVLADAEYYVNIDAPDEAEAIRTSKTWNGWSRTMNYPLQNHRILKDANIAAAAADARQTVEDNARILFQKIGFQFENEMVAKAVFLARRVSNDPNEQIKFLFELANWTTIVYGIVEKREFERVTQLTKEILANPLEAWKRLVSR